MSRLGRARPVSMKLRWRVDTPVSLESSSWLTRRRVRHSRSSDPTGATSVAVDMARTISERVVERRYLRGNRAAARGRRILSGNDDQGGEPMSAATTTTTYDQRLAPASDRRRLLRRIITGAAAFDAAMGVFCLVAASEIGDWLSIGTSAVRETGVVFLVAALVGGETALRKS